MEDFKQLNVNSVSFFHLIRLIKSDIKAYYPKGSVIKYLLIGYFLPKIRLIVYYRIGRFLYLKTKKLSFIHTYLRYRMYCLGGNEISFKAQIGTGFKIAHPTGIIIGDSTIIGNNVVIFQQVTFGSHGKKDGETMYPVVKDNVRIYAGVKVVGGVVIGENCIIGANAVVNKSLPADSIGYGIPCKVKGAV